jgi:hypothetical protein
MMRVKTFLKNAWMMCFAAGCALTVACGPAVAPIASGYTGSPDDQILLRVNNNNWHDMRVYLILGDESILLRLGTVTSQSSRTFRIRTLRSDGTVQLVLRPLGTRNAFPTPRVLVESGEMVRLDIENHLALTTLRPVGS